MEYRPSIVSWNVTGACHLRCPHCYLAAGRRFPDELSTEEGFLLIDQMARAGTELLILTGGEPLLRRDLPALSRQAADKGIRVVLGTTGTLLTAQTARTLKESGVAAAGISIDSLDAGKHDAFRGVLGAWQRAVRGIEACREAGIGVLVHTTALKMNKQEVPQIVQFAYEQGARAFHLFFLVCTGRGEQLTDLSPQEYEALLVFILEAQDRYPGMMVRARCAPYVARLAYQQGATLLWSTGCLAATSYCRVTPTGDVTPCPYLPVKAGNVRNASFQEIWDSSQVLARLRPPQRVLEGKCGGCSFSQGDSPICVGCRARAFAISGSELAADPWCLHEPQAEQSRPHQGVAPASLAGKKREGGTAPTWAPEALERLRRVPSFIRERVRQAAESYAGREGHSQVTTEMLDYLRQRAQGKPTSRQAAADGLACTHRT